MTEPAPSPVVGDDEVLARAAQAGDREAFAALVDRHAPAVGRLISAWIDRPVLVADLVQETFVAAWCALPRYRSGCFAAWLKRIALNAARQALRSAWTRRVQLVAVAASDEADPHQPAQVVARDERATAVRRAVDRLPADQAEAVRLRFLLDESYPAAATILGVPESTLRSRVLAALPRLRAELAPWVEEE
jgi:RNA polymerase sigma-70 factor (ECF subfamily)